MQKYGKDADLTTVCPIIFALPSLTAQNLEARDGV